MGPYCRFCGMRCFVPRVLRDGKTMLLATCTLGMAHDREASGEDHTTAVNPMTLKVTATQEKRIFTVPGPGGATKVTYEDHSGGPGEAALITEGNYRGLWRDNHGGLHDWCELLVQHEPLEEA